MDAHQLRCFTQHRFQDKRNHFTLRYLFLHAVVRSLTKWRDNGLTDWKDSQLQLITTDCIEAVTSPQRILEPSVGTHGNVGRRLRIAGDQRSLTQRRWVIHRTQLDRLPRQDIVKIVGDINHPILAWNLRTTAARPLRCGRQFP